MERIIEQTEDGSTTLFVPELNEHYHSVKGARTESQHIFIDMGLKASAATLPHILEIGFGTGLNALLTLETAGNVERRAFPAHICRHEQQRHTDHILCKRRYPQAFASHRI